MNRRRHRDMAVDVAMEEKRKAEERDNEGMCVACGDNPQNPELPRKQCLQCWRDSPFSCGRGECDNPTAVEVNQHRACELHAVELAHNIYADYVIQKCEVEDLEQELEDMVADVGFDPRENHGLPPDAPEGASDTINKHAELHMAEQELGTYKRMLERVRDNVDKVFADGFDPAI